MRFDAETEQKKFWKIFDEKLIENGEPFSILHEKAGKVTHWAMINKNYSLVDYGLSIDFLVRYKELRINIYLRNDLPFACYLGKNKEDIESMVSVPLKWIHGASNPNTRRIVFYKPIRIGNVEAYADAIDEILPVVMEMKKVCEKYGKDLFFDF